MMSRGPEAALYRGLVRVLLPGRFRDRHEEGLVEVFSDLLMEARANGGLGGRARVWLREVPALLRLTLGRRRKAPRGGSGRGGGGTRGRWSGPGVSWLDFKLGMRMLVRYPGLTVVGGLAMAGALAIAAASFEFSGNFLNPHIPLDQGERVVALQNWNTETGSPEPRSVHDFMTWRDDLRSVEELGAFTSYERNLITNDGQGMPVRGVEITAEGFRVPRVPPLLGRPLVAADEDPGAPPVVVVGYDLWQSRLGGNPDVVGTTVRLGTTTSTVVGVMPSGFSFPTQQNLWVPLRMNALEYERLEGPAIQIFGRLAAGITLDEAQAELAAIGRRTAIAFPATHERLRPRVMAYGEQFAEGLGPVLFVVQWIILMVLLIACANVGILVFARSATRESELVVRNALGASRSRIVLQLFVEALVLSSIAAGVGLVVAQLGLGKAFELMRTLQGAPPFWWSDTLSPRTIVYVGILTLVAAGVSGLLPALSVTGGRGRAGLGQVAARSIGLRFGKVATAAIVTQIALSVGLITMTMGEATGFLLNPGGDELSAAEEYLAVSLQMDGEARTSAPDEAYQVEIDNRVRNAREELERRVINEPQVTGITFASTLPGMTHPRRLIEVEGMPLPPDSPMGHEVSAADIDPDFFAVMGTPILAGRGFAQADVASDENAGPRIVVVNETFVRQLLGNAVALGQRLRFPTGSDEEPGPWYEIVGVVADFGMSPFDPERAAGIYQILAPTASPVNMAIHLAGAPRRFAPRLRSISTAVDPTLRLDGFIALDEIAKTWGAASRYIGLTITLLAAGALLLSLAGVYALMSFTVSQRTREIGIRSALGARPGRVASAIFRRALLQIGLGLVVGISLTVFLRLGDLEVAGPGLIVKVSMLMLGAGLLACSVPTSRALRVQPTEALRDGG